MYKQPKFTPLQQNK